MSQVTMDARHVFTLSEDELWALDNNGQSLRVKFDDGEVETTSRRLIYSAYMWELHQRYPKTPLLSHHCMGMERLTGKTHLNLLSNIYKDLFFIYKDDPNYNMVQSWKLIYEIVNTIYNTFIIKCSPYVASLCMLDLLDVIDHPSIKDAKDKLQPTQDSIDDAYTTVMQTLKTDPQFNDNELANAVRSSLLDGKQVNQCLTARGFVTEIDSMIFKRPIPVGFMDGRQSLYDHMIESRSASKALSFSKDPLEDCEYFNRKLQLVAQVSDALDQPGMYDPTVKWTDCGSQHYWAWRINSRQELESLEGMHYVDNGEIKAITGLETNLIDETINLRTVFGCLHPDPQTVCSTCFGQLAYSIPHGTSPGHVSAISLAELISQLVLSIKHVDGSSKVDAINIGDAYLDYLVVGSNPNTLKLSPAIYDTPIKLSIRSENVQGLHNIISNPSQEFSDMNLAEATEMRDVTFIIGDESDGDSAVHKEIVPVSMGSRLGSLSADMLTYLHAFGYELDEKGDIVIDLHKWNNNLPLFELPFKHTNMLDFQDQVQAFLLGMSDQKAREYKSRKSLMSYQEEPVEGVRALLELINTKLPGFNLAHVLMLSYCVSARDPDVGDYRLPKAGEPFKFIRIMTLMKNRSMGAMMAYEVQESAIMSPEMYVLKDRHRHRLDELLLG